MSAFFWRGGGAPHPPIDLCGFPKDLVPLVPPEVVFFFQEPEDPTPHANPAPIKSN